MTLIQGTVTQIVSAAKGDALLRERSCLCCCWVPGLSLARCFCGDTAVSPSFFLPLQETELFVPFCVWMADTVTNPFGRLLLAPRPGSF